MELTRTDAAKAARGARLWTWVARGVGIFFVLVLVGVVVFVIYDLNAQKVALTEQLRQRNETVQTLIEENSAVTENAQRLFDQLQALPGVEPEGDDPADLATETPGQTGATGERGPAGRDGDPGPGGPPGPPGANGSDGTNGSAGTPGGSGQDGASGPAGPQGEPGPPGAQGEPGVAGPVGADGMPGRGVASVECVFVESGTAFRFTFTDATTTDILAACLPIE